MTCVRNSRRALWAVLILIGSGAALAQDRIGQDRSRQDRSGQDRIAQDRIAQGRDLAFDRAKGNCLSCHAIPGGELPGAIGPPLEGVKARFPNRSDLVAIIQDETRRNPQTVMPPFGRNLILNDDEIESVVEFLNSL